MTVTDVITKYHRDEIFPEQNIKDKMSWFLAHNSM